jgi:hypothetical protein
MPKKKCKSPRSFNANDELRSWRSDAIALLEELVTIMSST